MSDRIPLPPVIAHERVIAVLRRLPLSRLRDVVAVLSAAGISIAEVTLDGDDALASISWLAGAGHVVGAGTVLSVEQAAAATSAGATFLVAPGFDPAVVDWAVTNAVPVIPGALTPTEISAAWTAGASAVKLFPASLGGPAYLASIRGPLGHIPFVATGGIDDSNALPFLESGAVAVGVGGWLSGSDQLATVAARAASLVGSLAPQR